MLNISVTGIKSSGVRVEVEEETVSPLKRPRKEKVQKSLEQYKSELLQEGEWQGPWTTTVVLNCYHSGDRDPVRQSAHKKAALIRGSLASALFHIVSTGTDGLVSLVCSILHLLTGLRDDREAAKRTSGPQMSQEVKEDVLQVLALAVHEFTYLEGNSDHYGNCILYCRLALKYLSS